MITKLQEYRAEIFKIAGFALITPMGGIFIEPVALFKECGLLMFIAYIVVSLSLALIGLSLIFKGYDILDLERRK